MFTGSSREICASHVRFASNMPLNFYVHLETLKLELYAHQRESLKGESYVHS